MRKIFIVIACVLLWLGAALPVVGQAPPPAQPPALTPSGQVPPVQPPPVHLTPTPALPFDGDGAKRMPGPGSFPENPSKPVQPTRAAQKVDVLEHYAIVGMYDRMLEQVQHKRLWPVGDFANGCATFHDGSQICQ